MAVDMNNQRGERLRRARLKKRLRQQDVAQQLHMSVSTYKAWENGRGEPRSLSVAARLCDLLDISLDYYVTGREAKTDKELQQLPKPVREAIKTLIKEYQ
ncbi:helix-turn-helix domain-containing protein [Motiliproteus sp.]|uniref:helix-turn-helix domain-containing protein n=1 Tax=Motiliproteus sp. TaxID=1898955 RepID=UPI003BA95011